MLARKFLRTHGAAQVVAALLLIVATAFEPKAWAASKYKVLYNFAGGSDGIGPNGLIFGPAGNLYGATDVGGGGGCTDYGCGTVFQLTPPDGKWGEKVLLRFKGMRGHFPDSGVITDAEGNLYGTASGHFGGYGTVFKLSPGANGKWRASVLHAFTGGNDGQTPYGGLVRDAGGNLYGTTDLGGGRGSCYNLYCGTVYELSPPRTKGGKWKEKILYRFRGKSDGGNPSAGMIFDGSGNLYGTTEIGGAYGWGTVFETEARLKREMDGERAPQLQSEYRWRRALQQCGFRCARQPVRHHLFRPGFKLWFGCRVNLRFARLEREFDPRFPGWQRRRQSLSRRDCRCGGQSLRHNIWRTKWRKRHGLRN